MSEALDIEVHDRLKEFQEATDQELADAIRIRAGVLPKTPQSQASMDKAWRLLETMRALLFRD